MNILHVGDMAGVAAITANTSSKLNHPSVVITDENTDIWDHGEYYGNVCPCSTTKVMTQVVRDSIDNYDYIVYHDRFDMAAEFDDLNMPSAFMFHGNQLRQAPELYPHVTNLQSIEKTFVVTEDLLKYAPEAVFFHRPIDLDLFYMDDNIERADIGICLTQDRYMEECNKIVEKEEHMVLVADRIRNMIPYSKMPKFLNGCKYYYDIKFQPTHPPMVLPELSMTALQALACGVEVWSNGIWFTKFPDIHSDEWSVKEFISVLLE